MYRLLLGYNLFVYLFVCHAPLSWTISLCFYLYIKLVDPIENRCKDEEVRAEAMRELLKRIVDHRMAAKSLSAPERDAVSCLTISLSFVRLINT